MIVKRLHSEILRQEPSGEGEVLDVKIKTHFAYLHRGRWIATERVSVVTREAERDETRREARKRLIGMAWSEVRDFLEGGPMPGDGETENFWAMEEGDPLPDSPEAPAVPDAPSAVHAPEAGSHL